MQIERKREPRQGGQEPGREESHLFAAFAQGEVFAQGGVERPVGHEQVVAHACALRAIAQIGKMRRRFFPDTPSCCNRG